MVLLVTLLHDLIGRCDAVVHLAGFFYGAEPPQRPPGHKRRSYTQIEYDVARELKKPLYLFLATENLVPDCLSVQSDEEKEVQLIHEHPHFRSVINNHARLLVETDLSEAEILARLRSSIEGNL
jgi:hypothetical protein